MATIKNPQVGDVFKEYPPAYRKKLHRLRKLILTTAKENIHDIGEIVETLKWGEPSYLPLKKNIGTTVRIHWLKSKPNQYGIYFNCQTNIISRIKKQFGEKFEYEGKRAIIFNADDDLPLEDLKECIAMALTYHLDKKLRDFSIK